MFYLSADPIDPGTSDISLANGAFAVFEGRVRSTNEGRAVLKLEYEAYDELALLEGEKVLAQALSHFEIYECRCYHRTGMLELGEVAIRVEVASVHRREAFRALEWIVDHVKSAVPIWKKEHYADGESEWLNCHSTPGGESEYYARQLRLPKLGADGQAKLGQSRVLVVGAGGLGCPALLYLCAAGVGKIGICEPDRVEFSNLHRQILYGVEDVGLEKVRVASERLRRLNPFVEIQCHALAVGESNVDELVAAYDLVLDCADNFKTKYLLNDACVKLGKPFVSSSVYREDGQILTFLPGEPCLRCIWPSQPPEGCVGDCAEVGILGFVPGVFGCLQAAEAVRLILNSESGGRLALFDVESLQSTEIAISKNPDCPVCGPGEIQIPAWEIHPKSRADLSGFTLIDIREQHELAEEPMPCTIGLWAPLSRTAPEDFLTMAEGPLLLVCRSGTRTGHVAAYLNEVGERRVFSLAGGRRTMQALFEVGRAPI